MAHFTIEPGSRLDQLDQAIGVANAAVDTVQAQRQHISDELATLVQTPATTYEVFGAQQQRLGWLRRELARLVTEEGQAIAARIQAQCAYQYAYQECSMAVRARDAEVQADPTIPGRAEALLAWWVGPPDAVQKVAQNGR